MKKEGKMQKIELFDGFQFAQASKSTFVRFRFRFGSVGCDAVSNEGDIINDHHFHMRTY